MRYHPLTQFARRSRFATEMDRPLIKLPHMQDDGTTD